MPWVRFTKAFDYHVRRNVTISYKAGYEGLVKAECAAQAKHLGRAVEIERQLIRKDKHASDPVK
jgi:hypothetical protein